jgi:hypothetical protein
MVGEPSFRRDCSPRSVGGYPRTDQRARSLIVDFQEMIRSKAATKLSGWLKHAKESRVSSFANRVEKDIAAVGTPLSQVRIVRPKARLPSSNSSNDRCTASPS